jgi:hypothetical protein
MSEYSHTVAGLIDKRREIAGKIEHTQGELHNLVVMLDHLDATIRLFDPDACGGCDIIPRNPLDEA